MPVGLDDRGIAEVDLEAERCLDVRKVRDQHRVGAGLRHRGDHLLHRLDPLWPWRRHWRARDWNKRLDQQRIGCLDSSERQPSGLEGTAQTAPQHLADRNAGILERCPDGASLILADFRQHGLSGAIGEIGRRLIARKSRAFVGAPVANDDYEAALLELIECRSRWLW